MRKSFLIKQDLIEQAAECEDTLAVGALLTSLRSGNDALPYVLTSVTELSLYLFDDSPSQTQKNRINNGLVYLEKMNYIQIEHCVNPYIKIKFNELNEEQQQNIYFLLLYAEDLFDIFRSNTKLNKFGLYNTFCTLIRYMDNSVRAGECRSKCCRLPLRYMAANLDMSSKTFGKYLNELERLKIIYVRHSDGRYNKAICTRETNIYCRYSDKELCNKYARKFSYMPEARDVHDVNFRRKMKQIYNQICNGKIDYPEETYNELIMYINDAETAIGYDINIVYEAQQKALKICN